MPVTFLPVKWGCFLRRLRGDLRTTCKAKLHLNSAHTRLKRIAFGGGTTLGLSLALWPTAPDSQPIPQEVPTKKNAQNYPDSEQTDYSYSDAGDERSVEEMTEHSGSFLARHSAHLKTLSGWNGLDFFKHSLSVQTISENMQGWTWPTALDFTVVRDRVSKLLLELGRAPGSLYSEIVSDAPDPVLYPEVEWDAEVRLGNDLCLSERAFLRERRRVMKGAFAKLMDASENEIDERDIPVVAIAGSGGGFRAMLNTTGSILGAQTSGLFPCVTYTAGVSGSCWALCVLYSGVGGASNPLHAARHMKERIKTSYLDMETLDQLITPPTNKYLLSNLLRKASAPMGRASLVDIYGTLLASRLLVPNHSGDLDYRHLSLHWLRRNVDNGSLPLPIFTAIQPVVDTEGIQDLENLRREQMTSIDPERTKALDEKQKHIQRSARHLWYEFTPFEIGCDETGAWIPSWSIGRRFEAGKNLERRPELGLAILSGIFGSAFCASLKLYFKEIQPKLQLLPHQLYGWLEEIVTENERDLGLIHPVVPDQIPNFLKGLTGHLKPGSPHEVTHQEHMSLMDAGAELNIPYYPLLRRDIDCIIALDASADSQELWFTRAEELAIKRGLRTWPKGTRWPTAVQSAFDPAISHANSPTPDPEASQANLNLARSQESELTSQADKQELSESNDDPKTPDSSLTRPPLATCEVWIGSSCSDDADSSRLDDLDEEALTLRDGIGVVYIPLVPNEHAVPGFDPFSISTWRTEVKLEESQALLDVAEANFLASKEKIIRLLRAIWLRKRREREEREWQERLRRIRKHVWNNVH